MNPPDRPLPVLGAIDVGTNAARLELARAHPDGGLETLHYERAAIRPGEGVYETGLMAQAVADRLVGTMQRFASRCELHGAQVRAVATSALRTARNADLVLERVHARAGIRLEPISGVEEARLICLGVCSGRPRDERTLVLDIGGGSTEVALANGGEPQGLWSLPLGAVRLTEMFGTADAATPEQVALLRAHAEQAILEGLGEAVHDMPDVAFGSSGTVRTVAEFATGGQAKHVSAEALAGALDELVAMPAAERRKRFSERRADIVVAGGLVLGALAQTLGVRSLHAVDRGLRNGLLVDLQQRARILPRERLLEDEALRIGRRFGFEEPHARQVTRFALQLFEDLAAVHGLPAETRSLLEVGAWLHDVGKAVSFQRHHKHGHYLIENTEIPGLVDRERTLAACIARFHRRTPPVASHPDLARLGPDEVELVRRLSTLLRVADALDRTHQQRVDAIETVVEDAGVTLTARSARDLQLEIWDAMQEAALFESVFGRPLTVRAASP